MDLTPPGLAGMSLGEARRSHWDVRRGPGPGGHGWLPTLGELLIDTLGQASRQGGQAPAGIQAAPASVTSRHGTGTLHAGRPGDKVTLVASEYSEGLHERGAAGRREFIRLVYGASTPPTTRASRCRGAGRTFDELGGQVFPGFWKKRSRRAGRSVAPRGPFRSPWPVAPGSPTLMRALMGGMAA